MEVSLCVPELGMYIYSYAKMFDKLLLARHINNFVGSGYGYVPRWAFRIYGDTDWVEISKTLNDWMQRGYLDILKDPEHAQDNENCVKMFNFVEATKPLPDHWIDYDRSPPLWKPPSS